MRCVLPGCSIDQTKHLANTFAGLASSARVYVISLYTRACCLDVPYIGVASECRRSNWSSLADMSVWDIEQCYLRIQVLSRRLRLTYYSFS